MVELSKGSELTSTVLSQSTGGRLRAVFRILSAEVWPGIDLRRFSGSGGSGGLRLELAPEAGALRLVRWARRGTTRAVQPVVKWTAHPLPPVGSWTTLEAELDENALTARIEGRPAIEVRLAHTWRGDFGVHIGGPPSAAQNTVDRAVELQRIDAWNIVERTGPLADHFRVGQLVLSLRP